MSDSLKLPGLAQSWRKKKEMMDTNKWLERERSIKANKRRELKEELLGGSNNWPACSGGGQKGSMGSLQPNQVLAVLIGQPKPGPLSPQQKD